MNTLIGSFGPFHPLLVHLPIGFLLLAIIFQWLAAIQKYAALAPAIRVSYLLGAVSAVLSCISGWLLSSGGEYDPQTVFFHQWFGISLAVIAFLAYFLTAKANGLLQRVVSLVLLVLMIITGHLGGTLTHGEGFLTKSVLSESGDTARKRKAIADINQAIVFTDIIQPIFDEKCGSCHSATKQKGALRLDAADWILKGGKHGAVYTEGNADSSELYKRMVLDRLEEKHMPPKGKPQLTEQELQVIHWWLSSRAGFSKKVNEVPRETAIAAVLHKFEGAPDKTVHKSDVPPAEVEQADPAAIDSLTANGISVTPVAMNSHYLQVSFVSLSKPDDRHMRLLKKISKQTVWLKLPGARFTPEVWKLLSDFRSLTRLSAEYSSLNDESITSLAPLRLLHYLNLVGTDVSVKGLSLLKDMPDLDHLYLGKTAVQTGQLAALKQWFPHAVIDSGNYTLPFLAADTQLLKAPVKKK
ncbi:c-type cytochrome domain-containing protein [Sediminibacterium soli]|uniref:c-type cytochrome domain-containing protein n=1 Tax=Sediminibacterium soli TaxID=2698829 RepID=UPI00137AA83F|nr:c-type cytochrome domain-containing protein [Sediminibacterium soli]NCI45587.1 hypothetical protein [Sediminibacterium soli]